MSNKYREASRILEGRLCCVKLRCALVCLRPVFSFILFLSVVILDKRIGHISSSSHGFKLTLTCTPPFVFFCCKGVQGNNSRGGKGKGGKGKGRGRGGLALLLLLTNRSLLFYRLLSLARVLPRFPLHSILLAPLFPLLPEMNAVLLSFRPSVLPQIKVASNSLPPSPSTARTFLPRTHIGGSGGGLKTLLYASEHGSVNKRVVYALVCETMKHKFILDELLQKTPLLQNKTTDMRPPMLQVMLFDFLFGKGIHGGGKVKRVLKECEVDVRRSLETLYKEHDVDTVEGLSQKLMAQQGIAPDVQRLFLANNKRKTAEERAADGGAEDANEPMPRYARVNTLQISMESSEVQELREAYPDVRDDAHVPHLLVFPPRTELHAHPLVQSGALVLQVPGVGVGMGVGWEEQLGGGE